MEQWTEHTRFIITLFVMLDHFDTTHNTIPDNNSYYSEDKKTTPKKNL